MAEHKIRGGGPVHDGDCPPCTEAMARAVERRQAISNPHRVGTKVHAKFENERFQGLRACDPRSELYWSM